MIIVNNSSLPHTYCKWVSLMQDKIAERNIQGILWNKIIHTLWVLMRQYKSLKCRGKKKRCLNTPKSITCFRGNKVEYFKTNHFVKSNWQVMMTISKKCADFKLSCSHYDGRRKLKRDTSQKSSKVFLLETVILNPLSGQSSILFFFFFLIMQERQSGKNKTNTASYLFFITFVCKCPAARFFQKFLSHQAAFCRSEVSSIFVCKFSKYRIQTIGNLC